MKSKKLLKSISIILCLLLLLSTSVYALPNDDINENIVFYDGIYFENEELISEYNKLDRATKDLLRSEDGTVVVSIGDKVEGMQVSDENSPSLYSVIKPETMSGQIMVLRSTDGNQFSIHFQVFWHRSPILKLKDKIAVSWAGGSALKDSYCRTLIGNTYVYSDDCLRAEVGNNSFVSYELTPHYSNYCLTAVISKSYEPGLKNITGGYAHKTFGPRDITVGVDSTKALSFSVGWGTTFDTMTPAFTTDYLY